MRTYRLLILLAAAELQAGVALLVGEPFGAFGSLNPTGHAAVYLSRICADSPVRLRRCEAGEAGAVISRYRSVGGYDWIAVPAVPYLYAVSRAEEAPQSAGAAAVAELRESFRRMYLDALVPGAAGGEAPMGDWVQLAGAAYDRQIYGFYLETTEADDDRLILHLNSRPNRARFNLLYRNCADFARDIINFYHPGALRRSLLADAGITTPKHAAKSLVSFGRRRPELGLSCFLIPQVPGSRSSRRLRGVSESLVRSKKYVIPLVFFQPWIAVTAAAAYLTAGRFNPGRHARSECPPGALPECVSAVPAATRGQAGGQGNSGRRAEPGQ